MAADQPEEYGEQLSGELIEANADMDTWEVGDTILVELLSTDLGIPLSLPVRIVGIEFDPDNGQHPVEFQVRQELIA